MRLFATYLCAIASLALPRVGAAEEAPEGVQPLRAIEDYAITRHDPRKGSQRVLPREEQVQQLAHAKVAIANYAAIRRDFFGGREISDQAIRAWLLDQVAYISTAQTQQTIFNEKIATSGKTRRAHRPSTYGRALVFEVFDPADPRRKLGLIDAKGNGLAKRIKRKNNQCDHCNGLSSLGEALREFAYERMVNAVQKHARSGRTTVNSYAVISTGFAIKQKDGTSAPAAIYLRQAHRRGVGNTGDLGRQRPLLEHYGIDPGFSVQGTPGGHLVDFGNYVGVAAKAPYALPLDRWGAPSKQDPQWDKPWKWGHETAKAFAAGRATPHDVWRYFRSLLGPMEALLKRTPRTSFDWQQAQADPMRALIHQLSTTKGLAAKKAAPPPSWQQLGKGRTRRLRAARRGPPRGRR